MALADTLEADVRQSTHFDGLQRCRFGQWYFPISDLSIGSSQRIHLHQYPHTPGAALEKLGREPYRIRVSPIFDETVTLYDRGLRGNGIRLYPDVLDRIHKMYEREVTAPLIVPTVGTIECMLVHFARRQRWQVRSGEEVEMEFIEDMTPSFKSKSLFRDSDVLLPEKAANMLALADAAGITGDDRNLLQKIGDLANKIMDLVNDGANEVFGIVDQAELFANNVAGGIQEINQLLERADQKISMLQNPQAWQVTEAIKDTWSAGTSLFNTVTKKNTSAIYVTPRAMTIQDVAHAIYGSTDRTLDILQQNEFPDALNIIAGTEVSYEAEVDITSGGI